MPSFPPKENGRPDRPQHNGNEDNNDDDYETNNRNGGEAQVSHEEKLANQIDLQMVSGAHIFLSSIRRV